MVDIHPKNILVSLRDENFESFIEGYLVNHPQDIYHGRYGELPDYAIASEDIATELPQHPSQFNFKLAGLGVGMLFKTNTDTAGYRLTMHVLSIQQLGLTRA